jgi:hypothetical protein
MKMIDTSCKLPVLENPYDLRSRSIRTAKYKLRRPIISKSPSLLNFFPHGIKKNELSFAEKSTNETRNYVALSQKAHKPHRAKFASLESIAVEKEKYKSSSFYQKYQDSCEYFNTSCEFATSAKEKKKASRHDILNRLGLTLEEPLRRYIFNWSVFWCEGELPVHDKPHFGLATNASKDQRFNTDKLKGSRNVQFEKDDYIFLLSNEKNLQGIQVLYFGVNFVYSAICQ